MKKPARSVGVTRAVVVGGSAGTAFQKSVIASLAVLLAGCHSQSQKAASKPNDSDTNWMLDQGTQGFMSEDRLFELRELPKNGSYEIDNYCASENDNDLAPNNPKYFVRVCVSYVPKLKKTLAPRFNGGIVDIDGFGRVHTYKYDTLDTTPSGEFRAFGSRDYERKVTAALTKANTVTINGVELEVGKPPWLAPPSPAQAPAEYHGEDQHQEGSDR
jgi:hypothetical protein